MGGGLPRPPRRKGQTVLRTEPPPPPEPTAHPGADGALPAQEGMDLSRSAPWPHGRAEVRGR